MPKTQKPDTRPGLNARPDAAADDGSTARATSVRQTSVRHWKILGITREILENALIERFQHNFGEFIADRQPLTWFLGLIIGIAVGYAALAFRYLISIFQLPWLMTTSERVASAAAAVPWWTVLLAPAVGGLIVGYILQRYMPGQRAHAVADVIEARSLRDCKHRSKNGTAERAARGHFTGIRRQRRARGARRPSGCNDRRVA